MHNITDCINNIINSLRSHANSKKKPSCWYDCELRNLKNKKERSYKSYLRNPNRYTKSASDLNKCIYEKRLMEKKNEFRTTLFQKHRGDIKKTWSMVNHLLGKSRGQVCQSLKLNDVLQSNPKTLANEFNA